MIETANELAQTIEHTLLSPEATPKQIDALCDEAIRYGFAAVCVAPIHVRRAADRLASANLIRGKRPFVVATVGFPLGANTTAIKAEEARRAVDDGAVEIDMVVSLGALVAGERKVVRNDIAAVASAAHSARGGVLKVILETAALTDDQIVLGCRCCAEGEADFVKTSTGFHPAGGASVEAVRLLHRTATPLKVKAAGGIRTAEMAFAMLNAGAARLGCSAGPTIIDTLDQNNT